MKHQLHAADQRVPVHVFFNNQSDFLYIYFFPLNSLVSESGSGGLTPQASTYLI